MMALELVKVFIGSCGMDSICFFHLLWGNTYFLGSKGPWYVLGGVQEAMFTNQGWKKRHYIGGSKVVEWNFECIVYL